MVFSLTHVLAWVVVVLGVFCAAVASAFDVPFDILSDSCSQSSCDSYSCCDSAVRIPLYQKKAGETRYFGITVSGLMCSSAGGATCEPDGTRTDAKGPQEYLAVASVVTNGASSNCLGRSEDAGRASSRLQDPRSSCGEHQRIVEVDDNGSAIYVFFPGSCDGSPQYFGEGTIHVTPDINIDANGVGCDPFDDDANVVSGKDAKYRDMTRLYITMTDTAPLIQCRLVIEDFDNLEHIFFAKPVTQLLSIDIRRVKFSARVQTQAIRFNSEVVNLQRLVMEDISHVAVNPELDSCSYFVDGKTQDYIYYHLFLFPGAVRNVPEFTVRRIRLNYTNLYTTFSNGAAGRLGIVQGSPNNLDTVNFLVDDVDLVYQTVANNSKPDVANLRSTCQLIVFGTSVALRANVDVRNTRVVCDIDAFHSETLAVFIDFAGFANTSSFVVDNISLIANATAKRDKGILSFIVFGNFEFEVSTLRLTRINVQITARRNPHDFAVAPVTFYIFTTGWQRGNLTVDTVEVSHAAVHITCVARVLNTLNVCVFDQANNNQNPVRFRQSFLMHNVTAGLTMAPSAVELPASEADAEIQGNVFLRAFRTVAIEYENSTSAFFAVTDTTLYLRSTRDVTIGGEIVECLVVFVDQSPARNFTLAGVRLETSRGFRLHGAGKLDFFVVILNSAGSFSRNDAAIDIRDITIDAGPLSSSKSVDMSALRIFHAFVTLHSLSVRQVRFHLSEMTGGDFVQVLAVAITGHVFDFGSATGILLEDILLDAPNTTGGSNLMFRHTAFFLPDQKKLAKTNFAAHRVVVIARFARVPNGGVEVAAVTFETSMAQQNVINDLSAPFQITDSRVVIGTVEAKHMIISVAFVGKACQRLNGGLVVRGCELSIAASSSSASSHATLTGGVCIAAVVHFGSYIFQSSRLLVENNRVLVGGGGITAHEEPIVVFVANFMGGIYDINTLELINGTIDVHGALRCLKPTLAEFVFVKVIVLEVAAVLDIGGKRQKTVAVSASRVMFHAGTVLVSTGVPDIEVAIRVGIFTVGTSGLALGADRGLLLLENNEVVAAAGSEIGALNNVTDFLVVDHRGPLVASQVVVRNCRVRVASFSDAAAQPRGAGVMFWSTVNVSLSISVTAVFIQLLGGPPPIIFVAYFHFPVTAAAIVCSDAVIDTTVTTATAPSRARLFLLFSNDKGNRVDQFMLRNTSMSVLLAPTVTEIGEISAMLIEFYENVEFGEVLIVDARMLVSASVSFIVGVAKIRLFSGGFYSTSSSVTARDCRVDVRAPGITFVDRGQWLPAVTILFMGVVISHGNVVAVNLTDVQMTADVGEIINERLSAAAQVQLVRVTSVKDFAPSTPHYISVRSSSIRVNTAAASTPPLCTPTNCTAIVFASVGAPFRGAISIVDSAIHATGGGASTIGVTRTFSPLGVNFTPVSPFGKENTIFISGPSRVSDIVADDLSAPLPSGLVDFRGCSSVTLLCKPSSVDLEAAQRLQLAAEHTAAKFVGGCASRTASSTRSRRTRSLTDNSTRSFNETASGAVATDSASLTPGTRTPSVSPPLFADLLPGTAALSTAGQVSAAGGALAAAFAGAPLDAAAMSRALIAMALLECGAASVEQKAPPDGRATNVWLQKELPFPFALIPGWRPDSGLQFPFLRGALLSHLLMLLIALGAAMCLGYVRQMKRQQEEQQQQQQQHQTLKLSSPRLHRARHSNNDNDSASYLAAPFFQFGLCFVACDSVYIGTLLGVELTAAAAPSWISISFLVLYTGLVVSALFVLLRVIAPTSGPAPLVVRSALFFAQPAGNFVAAWARRALQSKAGKLVAVADYAWQAASKAPVDLARGPPPSAVGPLAQLGTLVNKVFGPHLRTTSNTVERPWRKVAAPFVNLFSTVVPLILACVAGAALVRDDLCDFARGFCFAVSVVSFAVTLLLRPFLMPLQNILVVTLEFVVMVVALVCLPDVLAPSQFPLARMVIGIMTAAVCYVSLARRAVQLVLVFLSGARVVSRKALTRHIRAQLDALDDILSPSAARAATSSPQRAAAAVAGGTASLSTMMMMSPRSQQQQPQQVEMAEFGGESAAVEMKEVEETLLNRTSRVKKKRKM